MNVAQDKLARSIAVLAMVWAGAWASGQEELIPSSIRDGELICTNLPPGTVVTVEWASSATGPWTNNWEELEAAPVDSNGAMRASIPRFYRVRRSPATPDPAKWVWIEPGTFMMGSPESEPERVEAEGPQTEVTLTYGFWMGRYEVTQAEWTDVMGENPSYFQGDPSLPVEMVRWIDTTNYCGRLTERERAAGRLPAGYRYRLPREAEWEYACRAGTTTAFSYGPALLSGMANFDGRYEYDASGIGSSFNANGLFYDRTLPVGSYEPNAWGLYDMHGNIWEWTLDWWSDHLPGGKVINPKGPSEGPGPVRRGGLYTGYAVFCRSAWRYWGNPTLRHEYLGFRAVLAPEDS